MADELSIKISANTQEVKAAENELVIMQKTVGRLNGELQKNKSSWGGVTSSVTAASTAFMAINTAVHQYVIAPLKQAMTTFMEFGDALAKTSQRVGIGVESLGALKFAAEQCGANFTILTEGIKAFQNQLGAASMGDTSAIAKLGKVGLDAGSFAGLSEEDQLMKLADHIKSIGDKATQTRVAMDLFGKSGFKLLPFFQEGSAGIKKLMAEGKDIGAVLGEEGVNAAVEMTDAMNRLKTSATAISNVFIANLAPSISSVLDYLTKGAKICTKFVSDYAPLVTGVGASIAIFVGWKSVVLGITTALPALIAGLKGVALAVAANPLLAGGAVAIGAIAGAWMLWNKHIAETEKRLYSISDAASKHVAEMEKAHSADQKLFDRLQELADIEDPLSNAEIEEANALIATLTSKYGDLGIEIDKDTGKIKGMAEAQKKMLEQQRQDKIHALQLQIAEENANLDRLEKKYARKKTNVIGKGKELLGYDALSKEDQEDFRRESDIILRRKAEAIRQLRQLDPIDDEPEEEEGTAEEPVEEVYYDPAALDEMETKSRETRAEREAAQKELAGMKEDADLDFRSAQEKALADLNAKVAEKYAAVDKKIELTQKAGGEGVDEKVAKLQEDYAKIEQWRQQELEKITQGVIDEQQKAADQEYAAWKERNPEIDQLPTKDARVSSAEATVQAARQKQADAILSGGDLAQADSELKAAQEGLAKAVAEASGEARSKAQERLTAAQEAYDKGVKAKLDPADLNDLAKKVREAQAEYDTQNEAYFNAVGQLRKETEEQTAEAVQTTLSSAGTFSAYGMDAAVISDIPQQQLEVLRKLLDNTDQIKEEQKNEGAYTK